MDRRSLLFSATAVPISTGAFAETKGPAPGPFRGAGKAETDHMQNTMGFGSLALATSSVAVQKGAESASEGVRSV